MIFKHAKNIRVTQTYGGKHGGIDLVGVESQLIHSVTAGRVVIASMQTGLSKSYGILIVVEGADGKRYYYAHLQSMAVEVGQTVDVGQLIGLMGNTGKSTGAHLHFEVRTGKTTATRINPAAVVGVPNLRGTYPINDKPPDIKDATYIVKSGDTLTSIAQKYGVSADEIAKHNKIDNVDFIRVNQILKILVDGKQQTAEKGDRVKVKTGARDFNGKNLAAWVYNAEFEILEISGGDRIVIGIEGRVTAALKSSELIKI